MDEQTDKYAWVGPYMRSRQIVAVPAVSTLWSIEDLAGKRIAVLVGSKAERIFLQRSDENIPKVRNVYALNKTDELATALRNDYVDAIAGDAATVRRVLQNEEIEFRFFDEDLRDTACGIAFSKDGDAALREALAAAMTDMLHDGVAASILERYGAETDTTSGGLGNE